jgi:hypothetical protein
MFNLRGFCRFARRVLFETDDPDFCYKPRRVGVLAAFFLGFPLLELLNWAGFGMDEVFFQDYRRQAIEKPVFILGHPRSGTTFLHRLLAKDIERFTTMHTWEIFLAPSVVQRRVVQSLLSLDRLVGCPLQKLVARLEARWAQRLVMQQVGIRMPEEDDYLLLHIWSALAGWMYSGVLEGTRPYTHFDTAQPLAEKRRIMTFYRQCVQRHLYAHGGNRHYLAKNPALSPKIDALYDTFPDARVICIVRSPLEAIPSYVSFLQHLYRVLGYPVQGYALRDFVLDTARHWYRYPLQRLEQAPKDRHIVLCYDDLVRDPKQVVADIYARFNFAVTSSYTSILAEETKRAQRFCSRHRYSLKQMGLTHEHVLSEFEDIFERFAFETHPSEPPALGSVPGRTAAEL